MIYLDTSAFLKSVWKEEESEALGRYLGERSGEPLVSSAILTIETRRSVLRNVPALLDVLITYDKRLAEAARARKIPTVAPG